MADGGKKRDIFSYVKTLGWDGETARQAFLNDETFYMQCLREFLDEPVFQVLLQDDRMEHAAQIFPAAHYLTGSAAVLGITPMAGILSEITECFRNKNAAPGKAEELWKTAGPLWEMLDAEYLSLKTAAQSLDAGV